MRSNQESDNHIVGSPGQDEFANPLVVEDFIANKSGASLYLTRLINDPQTVLFPFAGNEATRNECFNFTSGGVLLRYFGGDLADCVRITVGSPEENACLLAAFAELAEI